MSLLLPALAAGQTFVQVNSNAAVLVNKNSVAVAFSNPQVAGNLNVVVVGWNDTSATIGSVTDSNGNIYASAAGTTSTPLPPPSPSQGGISQAIYYAKNIKAGANTVTVTLNQNATAIESVRVVEYSGLDLTNPLDTSVGGSGSSTPADSGAATTNSANDLLFGAGTISTGFTGHGPGFVTRLVNGFGDIVEDEPVTAAGSHNATATLTSGNWVMQMAAFRVAGQTPPTFSAPAIASISTPSSPEAGGIALTITGTNFQPGATVLFSNGAVSASGVNCTVTLLVSPNATVACLTPSFPMGSAGITVTNVDGQVSPSFAFSFTTSTPFGTATSPSITPNTGPTNGGTAVIISGSDFAAGAKVTVGGVPAANVSVANINTIQANLPAGPSGQATVVVTNPSNTTGTLAGGYTYAPGVGINFVQVNSAQPTSPATTATITYSIAQSAGNLNVVIIGWADATTTVQSVIDSAGNTYTLAFSPTIGTALSQAIYYAKNIKASPSNTVTVSFSAAAQGPDVRVLEYSGLDTGTPLDAAGGTAGTGTALDSGPITIGNAGDLIIGAAEVGGTVTSAGGGFITVSITPYGDSVEHLIGPPAGMIDTTATQNPSAPWVMQAVAFRQAAGGPDFAVSVAPPGTATVTPGNSASYTISVSGLNGFNSAVTLTCPAGLPSGAMCAFVPPSVTPGSAPVTSSLTIATSATASAGTSNVTVTGTSGSLTHSTSVSLTVNASADFTIAASALSPATVPAGGSATSSITITPSNGFTGMVSLTCSVTGGGTPLPTRSFNPTSVANGSGTSTLTVSTTAAHASLTPPSRGIFYAMWLPIGGLALLGTGLTSRKKRFLCLLLGCLLFSGLIFLAACGGSTSSGGGGGGGHPGTPAGTYTITVTGTSGSLTHPATVSLTVQ